jgi:hypothetical protein
MSSFDRCQSCSIPLKKEEYLGTEEDGSKAEDFCVLCYKDGQFTEPMISQSEMASKITDLIAEKSKADKASLRLAIELTLSSLKRWKNIA